MSTITSENDTLPDNAWLDSFDKLVGNREFLRLNNVVQKYVDVARNMNSSYENSTTKETSIYSPIIRKNHHVFQISSTIKRNQNIPVIAPTILVESSPKLNINHTDSNIIEKEKNHNNSKDVIYLDIPFENKNGDNNNKQVKIDDYYVSTPVKLDTEPFECPMSPIDMFRFINVDNHTGKSVSKQVKPKRSTRCNKKTVSANTDTEIIESLKKPIIDVSTNSPWTILKQKRQVQFENKNKLSKMSIEGENKRILAVAPGKWRKSLYQLRRSSNRKLHDTSLRKSIILHTDEGDKDISAYMVQDAKKQVLQFCQPRRIVTLKDVYTLKFLRNCRKIGEGTFGEVFMHSDENSSNRIVLKVIPIEGKQTINGEVQKTFEQILSEIVITVGLNTLNNQTSLNMTKGFINVQQVKCVKGKYPDHLVHLWEEYDDLKGSENDHPKCFDSKQQFIVLELAYGGQDLENYVFRNAEQSYFMLQQIILTLAVGEEAFQFEHRDLHWGNVLIMETTDNHISFKLNGRDITIPTKGIKMTIIDYTLSRLTYNNRCYYCDLSNEDDLFNATGDYQFDVYRMMKDIINNKWHDFIPKTNVFWISYIINKLLKGITYRSKRSTIHNRYIRKLNELNDIILQFDSCVDCVRHLFDLT